MVALEIEGRHLLATEPEDRPFAVAAGWENAEVPVHQGQVVVVVDFDLAVAGAAFGAAGGVAAAAES